MKTYRYKALNLKGEKLYGIFNENNEDDIRMLIKKQGYFIVKKSCTKSIFVLNKKITFKELAIFCGNFASILKAGINLSDGILLLANSQSKKSVRDSLLEIHKSVNRGTGLWESIKVYKEIYPDFFINMLRIGEYSGTLDLVLENLNIFYAYEDKICKQIKSSLLYPIILSITCIVVFLVLMIKVMPAMLETLYSIGGEVPAATKILVVTMDIVSRYKFLILISIMLIFVMVKVVSIHYKFKMLKDKLKLKIPIYKDVYTKIFLSRFANAISLMLKSGVNIERSLELTNETIHNNYISSKLIDSLNELRSGKSLSLSLKETKIFPETIISMIKIGEDTGNLDEMFKSSSRILTYELNGILENLAKLIEPIVILLIALVIGFIISGVMLPMLNILNSL